MGLKKVLAGLLASSVATFALAEARPNASALSYDHVGIRYIDQDVDRFDCGQDGLEIYGSMTLNNDFFAVGSFSDVSGGICGSSALAVGAGIRHGFRPEIDLFATLSLQRVSPDAVDDDDTGLLVSGGFRTFLTKQIEGRASLFHSTTGEGETGISGQALFWFHERYAGSVDLTLGDESSTIGVGIRANF